MGIQRADYICPGDMIPDPKQWIALNGGREDLADDEPIDWKVWAEKYPGLIKFPEKEVELPMCAWGVTFQSAVEINKAAVHWLPIPMHLRREDAGDAKIPEFDFDDYPMGWDNGI